MIQNQGIVLHIYIIHNFWYQECLTAGLLSVCSMHLFLCIPSQVQPDGMLLGPDAPRQTQVQSAVCCPHRLPPNPRHLHLAPSAPSIGNYQVLQSQHYGEWQGDYRSCVIFDIVTKQ